MTPERLFSLANAAALVGWILLAAFPRQRLVTATIAGMVLPLLLGVLYLGLFVSQIGRAQGGFGSLAQVQALFQNPFLLLAGWVHYLAFDLFIGAWEARDAERLGISRWALLPCQALTFLVGPVGLLAWLGTRAVLARRVPAV